MTRRLALPSRKALLFALLQAAVLTLLFWAVFAAGFERINLKAPSVEPAGAGFKGTIDLGEKSLGQAASWLVFVRAVQGKEGRGAADVVLNGTKLEPVEPVMGSSREAFAPVPAGLLRPGSNDVEVAAAENDWAPAEIRLQNYYGYASGILNLVLVARRAAAGRGLSWPALAVIFLVLLVCQAVRARNPRIARVERVHIVLKALAVAALIGVAAVPFLTEYRLIYLANRVWLFLVALNFSVVAAASKEISRRVKRDLGVEALAAKPSRRRIVSLAIPAVIFLFFLSSMLAVKDRFGGNYSRFLRIEEKRLEAFAPLYFPSGPDGRIQADVLPLEGYDGEFNYFMAFDPFLSKFKSRPSQYAAFIDEPAYRYGRIGFPLLVKLFSADRPERYPKTIVWLIVLSHFFAAFFFLKIILALGRHPFWTFLSLLVPGFYYSLHWGLPESVGLVFLLAGLYTYLKDRPVWAAGLFAASLLIRETGFIVVLAAAGYEVLKKKNFKKAGVIACSVVPYLAWRGFLTVRLFDIYGWKAFFFSPGDFTIPFTGFFDLYSHLAARDYAEVFVRTAAVYPVLLAAIFAFAVYFFLKDRGPLSGALLLYALVSVCLNYEMIWSGIGNGIRGTFEAFVFLILAMLAWKGEWTAGRKYAAAGFFAAVFVFLFFLMDISEFFRAAFRIW